MNDATIFKVSGNSTLGSGNIFRLEKKEISTMFTSWVVILYTTRRTNMYREIKLYQAYPIAVLVSTVP